MRNQIKQLRDQFLEMLHEVARTEMVINLVSLVQGEDAFLLRLYINQKMSPKQLCEELYVTKGRISALVNSLSKREYIKLDINPEDRRSILIELSESGTHYLEKKLNDAQNHFELIFKLAGYETVLMFVESMKSIVEKMREVYHAKNS